LHNSQIIGVIPARFASSRLPGKPLAEIDGIPMVVRVAKQARLASLLDDVVVATDDLRILKAVTEAGEKAVMSGENCQSGTDRAAEVASQMNTDIIINIQGDEPFIDPASIDTAVRLLLDDEAVDMGTLVCPISERSVLFSPDTVKVVVDRDHNALYFSRSPIPFCRDTDEKQQWLECGPYWQHIGLYAYRSSFLNQYAQWRQTPLEQLEKLEQLRALENGVKIRVGVVEEIPLSVDTPEDLEKARATALRLQENRKEGSFET